MKHRMEAKPLSNKTSSSDEEKLFYICFDFITFSFLHNYFARVSSKSNCRKKTKITKKKSRIKIKNVHHQVMQVLTEGTKLSTVIKTLLACFFHSPSRVLMLLIQLRMISIVKKHDNCHTLDCTFIYYFFSSFYIQ
jgi:hypothetical protein